ncbi:MAG: ribonuclease III [Acidobacteria bacterium]|nr:MAG: ribonuclease III [Acidobacteriota bacterium]
MKAKEIAALEGLLGYHFQRPELLDQALTHSSQARELEAQQSPKDGLRPGDNEQLEFLGDAVLALVTGEELFRRFPAFQEGQLSKLRAHLVSERHLVQVAQGLGLGTYLRLGRGEEKSGGRGKTALLVDALEAVFAALYLDGGLEIARRFILQTVVAPELARMNPESAGVPVMDFKSALQETLQATGRPQASYVLVKEAGPEHSKTFTVEVRLSSAAQAKVEFTGRAEGSTKKKAEQDAARQVLQYLDSLTSNPEEKPAPKSPAR